jgi:hypothetical protein
MADGSDKKGSDTPTQHPYVEQIRPDPSQPPKPVVTLTGLLGRSDRDGHQRLYFTRDLSTFAEFLASDVVYVEPVSAADSPIPGIDASRVTLNQDATVHYTRSTKATALGEFDLNVRSAAPQALPVPTTRVPCATLGGQRTCIDVCTDDTCRTDCGTCNTCQTRCAQHTCGATCQTCQTQCGQNTCQNTCQTCQTQCGQNTCVTCQTCQTQCGQATCQTCQTQCNQATCHTCQTRCAQDTCVTCHTCDTCNPHVFTCGPNPQCRFPQ